MDVPRLILAAFAVAVICFGGGFGFGRLRSSGGGHGDKATVGTGAVDRPVGGSVLSALSGKSTGLARANLKAIARSGEYGLFRKTRAYLRLVMAAGANELPLLLREIRREVPEDLGGDGLAEIAVGRWAELDPIGALEAILDGSLDQGADEIFKNLPDGEIDHAWDLLQGLNGSHNPSIKRGVLVVGLLGKIAESDFGEAVAKLKSLPNPLPYAADLIDFFEGRAASDPAQALRAADGLPSMLFSEEFYNVAFAGLARLDPKAAIEQAQGMASLSRRANALRGVAEGFADTDVDAALAWAHSLQSSSMRDDALQTVLDRQLRNDPAAAAAEVMKLSSPGLREGLAGEIAGRWYGEDREAAVGWVRSELEGMARENAYEGMLDNHGQEMEFELQREMADAIPGAPRAKRQFIARWASDAPLAALDWAAGQAPEVTGVFFQAAFDRWVGDDFPAAARHVSAIEDPEMKRQAIEQIYDRVANSPDRGDDFGADEGLDPELRMRIKQARGESEGEGS